MKKLILLLLSLLIIGLPCFAEYKPIPKELSKQYKKEMESIIERKYPLIIKNIDDEIIEATELYKNILKNGYYTNNKMDAINLNLIYEICIPSASLEMYAELVKITKQKYLGQKHEPLGTDWVNSYEKFLRPYFKDNNIDTTKLDDLVIYETIQGKRIKGYLEHIKQLRQISD